MILKKMDSLLEHVATLCSRVAQVEDRVAALAEQIASKGVKNEARRLAYSKKREHEQKGRLPLPSRHVLDFPDRRIRVHFSRWAAAGLRFGAAAADAGLPGSRAARDFCTWLTHEWNTRTYLKKPITFSGSSFRVWMGELRHPWGARDLMHYYAKRDKCLLLRNESEHDDFGKRPWWNWCSYVLRNVVYEMRESEEEAARLPPDFVRNLDLLIGGTSMTAVLPDGTCWDVRESFPNVNRMIKRIGPELHGLLRACFIGLRASSSPVAVPEPSRRPAGAAGAARLCPAATAPPRAPRSP